MSSGALNSNNLLGTVCAVLLLQMLGGSQNTNNNNSSANTSFNPFAMGGSDSFTSNNYNPQLVNDRAILNSALQTDGTSLGQEKYADLQANGYVTPQNLAAQITGDTSGDANASVVTADLTQYQNDQITQRFAPFDQTDANDLSTQLSTDGVNLSSQSLQSSVQTAIQQAIQGVIDNAVGSAGNVSTINSDLSNIFAAQTNPNTPSPVSTTNGPQITDSSNGTPTITLNGQTASLILSPLIISPDEMDNLIYKGQFPNGDQVTYYPSYSNTFTNSPQTLPATVNVSGNDVDQLWTQNSNGSWTESQPPQMQLPIVYS